MDQTAQDTQQLSQQQVRPLAEPPMRDVAAQPPANITQQQTPSMPKSISVGGAEMGRIQVADEDEEDDAGGSQQVTPLQSQTPSEIIHEPTTEKVVTQAVPQEVAQQSSEMVRPAIPEVEVPKEIGHLVQKTPLTNNPFLPPELQNAGVRHTIPQVVVPQNPYGIKELPLPYEEAVAKEKAFRPQDAAKWLAAKVHYYWRKINPEVYR